MRKAPLPRLALLSLPMLLAACSDPADQPPEPRKTMMPVEPDGGIGDGAEPLPAAEDATIPAAFQGRWGINPGDCTDANGDAKGSITISDDQLRFYESLATIDIVSERGADTIRATYNFTGEGQEWSRDIKLAISEDGTELTRTEYGEEAMTDPATYTKCQA